MGMTADYGKHHEQWVNRSEKEIQNAEGPYVQTTESQYVCKVNRGKFSSCCIIFNKSNQQKKFTSYTTGAKKTTSRSQRVMLAILSFKCLEPLILQNWVPPWFLSAKSD